jgi:hypothetical protein
MMQHQIRSPEDIVAYITDCTLATVCDLSMKKSASKSERLRQISIAQTALDKGLQCGVSFRGTRAAVIIERYGCDVATWAETFKP